MSTVNQNEPAQTQATAPLEPGRLAEFGELPAMARAVKEVFGHPLAQPGVLAAVGLHGEEALVGLVDGVRVAVPALLAEVERLKADRAATLNEAIEAARGEYLTDNTGTPEDEAYNQGVTDAIAAIGHLLEGGAS